MPMAARPNQARGERHGRAKLTVAQVWSLQRMVVEGVSRAQVARYFKISRRQVGRIVAGIHWREEKQDDRP